MFFCLSVLETLRKINYIAYNLVSGNFTTTHHNEENNNDNNYLPFYTNFYVWTDI